MYKITDKIKNKIELEKVKQALDRLCQSEDVVYRLHGNCIGASDIVQNLLSFYGIESRVVECQLFAIKENKDMKEFCFVGFNSIGLNPANVDTHVVVITETEEPLLIDASIGHLLSEKEKILVKKLQPQLNDVFGKYIIDDISFTYSIKKNIKLPALHQKTLLDRINEDRVIKEKVNFITKAVIILASISVINFSLNSILILLKTMYL